MIVRNDDAIKRFRSPDYNYVFCKENGYFARWGKTFADDPQWSPFGNEILDIEITTSCTGNCPFCYKANTPDGKNMSLNVFTSIIDRMPSTLTQIAIGADARARSNTDIWRMMEYCRARDIVPNITVANISSGTAQRLANYCGAVAVSRYADENNCYESVYRLTENGLQQVNIHQLLAEETFEMAMHTVASCITDYRLEKLNALVFLALKKKGRGVGYTPLSMEKLQELVDAAQVNGIRIGFDSCSAHKAVEVMPSANPTTVEPCESACFSAYINVNGAFFPCSFCEGTEGWETGINVPLCDDFVRDVWNHPRTIEFRNRLLSNGRRCPIYEV